MTVTYGFFNSVAGDRKYDAVQMSKIFDGVITDGVYSNIGSKLMVTASGGMQVAVGTGRAWFDHTWTLNDTNLFLNITGSDAILNRIDAIVLEVDSSDAVRANSIKVIRGIPGTIPLQPTMVKTTYVHQYPLAYISVTAGLVAITQAKITNMVGTTDCPFVVGAAQGVSTSDLLAQWQNQWTTWTTDQQNEFTTWFNAMKNQLTTDAAGNLQSEIDALDIAMQNGDDAVRAEFAAADKNIPRMNLIYNGWMQIWQRGTATQTSPATGTYGPDRFKVVYNFYNGGSFKFDYDATYQMFKITTIGTEAVINAASNMSIRYVMEGRDWALIRATPGGMALMLQFSVIASKTGKYCVAITTPGSGGAVSSYIVEYTITQANILQTFYIPLNMFNMTGAGLDNAIGMTFAWSLIAGSTYTSATTESWISGLTKYATANQVNVFSTANSVFELGNVKLSYGTEWPLFFQDRPYQQELAICQRYYSVLPAADTYTRFGIGQVRTATRAYIDVQFPTTMRISPTLSHNGAAKFAVTDGAGTTYPLTALAIAANTTSPQGTVLMADIATASLTPGYATRLTANNDATAQLGFNADF